MKLNFRKQFEEDMQESFEYMINKIEEKDKCPKDVGRWIMNTMKPLVYGILGEKRTNGTDEEELE